jgi:uncharacterized protein
VSRVDGHVVVGGTWHDFDYARLQLLQHLADEPDVRVTVAGDYHDTDRLAACAFLVTYTCDLRPSLDEQQALRTWVEGGGRWLALHGTNSAIDPPPKLGEGPFTTPRAFPLHAETVGSQFLSHPPMERFTVTVVPHNEHDPLVAGLGDFEAGEDELYLTEQTAPLVRLLETRWAGVPKGFAEDQWTDDHPRLVLYRRPLGDGEVVYFTLGHCRSRWDMIAPPFHGMEWPRTERGSWDVPAYREVLRRGIRWAAGSPDMTRPDGVQAEIVEPYVGPRDVPR